MKGTIVVAAGGRRVVRRVRGDGAGGRIDADADADAGIGESTRRDTLMKRSQRTPLMTFLPVAFSLLLAGCEEMMEGTAQVSTAPALIEAPVRKALGVPGGLQVVVTGTHAEGTRYVLRNPEVARATTGSRSITRRHTVASVDTEGVADQFDTPERVASVRDGAVQFTEVSTFLEIFEAREDAEFLVSQAVDLLQYFGAALRAGGLDVDAVEDWTERQRGIVEQMETWIADAHAQYATGPLLPESTVQVEWYHDKVLAIVAGTVGEPIAAKVLPKSTGGGYGTLTYCLSDYCADAASVFGGGDPLPTGVKFDPDTREVSGTPVPVQEHFFNQGHYVVQYVVFDELGRSESARVAFDIRAASGGVQ